MYYTALPFEFHPSDYKKYLSLIYGRSFNVFSPESRFLKEILDYVSSQWDYGRDSWFYNTMAYLLLTGCRISELTTIKSMWINDNVIITLYCAKQHLTRKISINKGFSDIVLNDFFGRGYVTQNEKEFNRRFKKIYPELQKVAKIKRINEGSHLCRHIHCCTAFYGCGALQEEITRQFMWANDKMIDEYLKLCQPLK
jgi:hypothetical protein